MKKLLLLSFTLVTTIGAQHHAAYLAVVFNNTNQTLFMKTPGAKRIKIKQGSAFSPTKHGVVELYPTKNTIEFVDKDDRNMGTLSYDHEVISISKPILSPRNRFRPSTPLLLASSSCRLDTSAGVVLSWDGDESMLKYGDFELNEVLVDLRGDALLDSTINVTPVTTKENKAVTPLKLVAHLIPEGLLPGSIILT